MRRHISALCLGIVLTIPGIASADPGKDESGNRWRGEYRDDYRGGRYGRGYGDYAREYKEEFRRGDCKIARKWERGGEYKEEIKCKGRRW